MNRKIWPYFIVAFLSVALALWAQFRKPSVTRQGKPWVSIEAKDIELISFESQERLVRFQALGSSLAWVEVLTSERNRESFLVGEKFRDLLFHFSPIWANRTLGLSSPQRLKEFGFEDKAKRLTLTLRNQKPKIFLIGARGFRSESFFTLDSLKNEIFLWDREPIDLMADPARAAIKTPIFLQPEALNRVVIKDPKHPNRSRNLVKLQKIWREDVKALSVDDDALSLLEQLSTVPIRGYKERSEITMKLLLRFDCDGESRFSVSLLHDPSDQKYWLDFGADRPQILLDTLQTEKVLQLWEGQ